MGAESEAKFGIILPVSVYVRGMKQKADNNRGTSPGYYSAIPLSCIGFEQNFNDEKIAYDE